MTEHSSPDTTPLLNRLHDFVAAESKRWINFGTGDLYSIEVSPAGKLVQEAIEALARHAQQPASPENAVTVTIIANGDNENTPAEAVHHALEYARKAGFIEGWSDPAQEEPNGHMFECPGCGIDCADPNMQHKPHCPRAPAQSRNEAIEQCARHVETTGLRNPDNIARDLRALAVTSTDGGDT